jgi:hypothetical protein
MTVADQANQETGMLGVQTQYDIGSVAGEEPICSLKKLLIDNCIVLAFIGLAFVRYFS